jgi:ABC-type transport system involved in multi-copper enzyme maturation permease subunit
VTQTVAIFVDAYRSLNSKKLFWIALAISALVVGAFACVGLNDHGMKILFWQIDSPFNAKLIAPATFYKQMFVSGGISFWLSWLATILALVSTAGIFPDLIGSGAIDLFLCKPIGRLRLFATQYAAGLLFVTLQVTIFSVASFLVIGLRGGVWEPGLLVAVPVVVCFFSYLFSICVLLGVLTRSTVAALLLTLLAWFMVYAIGAAEQSVLMFQTMEKHGVTLGQMSQHPPAAPITKHGAKDKAAVKEVAKIAPKDDAAADRGESNVAKLEMAHRILYGVITVLPKTTETITLLQRWLVRLADLPPEPASPQQQAMRSAQRELAEALYRRSPFWIVGTSLAFEFVVLAWAAWLFCRRDF